MPRYLIECADRETGGAYRVEVTAPSEDDALLLASQDHTVARARLIEDADGRAAPPASPPPSSLSSIDARLAAIEKLCSPAQLERNIRRGVGSGVLAGGLGVLIVAVGVIAFVLLLFQPR